MTDRTHTFRSTSKLLCFDGLLPITSYSSYDHLCWRHAVANVLDVIIFLTPSASHRINDESLTAQPSQVQQLQCRTSVELIWIASTVIINNVADFRRPYPEYIWRVSLLDYQPSATMTQPPSQTAPVLLGKLSCTQPSIHNLC